MNRTPILLSCLLWLCCGIAHGSALSVANAIRAQGCDGRRGLSSPLQDDERIDAIARRWSSGGRLKHALPEGYGSARFVSLHVAGVRDEDMLQRLLAERLCTALSDPQFNRLGMHREQSTYWIVLAAVADSPRVQDAGTLRQEALRLVNQARAQPRRCGQQRFPAAKPLRSNARLDRAAEGHARNMAQHRQLQHAGFDGSTPAQRIAAAGYVWRAAGENIAAGPTTAAEVVAMWLDSPPHCANIMSPNFSEMGLAFAEESAGDSGVYWAQTFGSPP